MVKNFSQIKKQIQNLWNNFNKKAKIVIIVSALVTFIGMLLLAHWASKPEYMVLFNNLSMEDAGGIINSLDEKQITYQLKDNGSTILVPQKNVHKLRLDLASQGLPTGGNVGFEIFDRNQIGSTDFEQKVQFNRALSGELARTIKQLDNVLAANVRITPSESSIYKEQEEPAKASVVLKLKQYTKLTTKEVKSIANLVASSVNGLDPTRVTIVDTTGNLLSAKLKEDDEKADISDKLALQNKFEEAIEKDLNVMLTKVLGMGNFSLAVNATLNFDQRNIESKRYEPVVDDEGIIRSKQSKTESSQGMTTTPEGVPGTTSNLPQYKINNQDRTEHDKEEEIVNYEINEEVEKYVQAPGTLEKLSVAVTVDTPDGQLDAAKQEAITNLISAAVGYDVNRGDQITVIGMAFDNSLEEEVINAEASEAAKRRTILLSLLIGIAILIAVLLIVLYRKRRNEMGSEAEVGQNVDYLIDEAEEEFAVGDNLTSEERERQKLQNQLRNIIKDQPEEIAGLIKSWLSED
ncbi:flagellar basal-body MS-ring/collar protein FliF [Orenia marismortui]|uniref:Flagellar M-ring protein n=1 Tax=Orenia marismortui TaxID=46469 RepID=A0A4R8H4S8_9FIRM|nr:flagellar basal-body MS-ring/collar protein FliF [Orenia marismortui]TDX51935.1 flagellar M-ring protein FliF [Orenia marismortui]